MNPNVQSGKYFIDPDGHIGGDEPFKVYRDMGTGNSRNTDVFSIITTPLKRIYYQYYNRDHIDVS